MHASSPSPTAPSRRLVWRPGPTPAGRPVVGAFPVLLLALIVALAVGATLGAGGVAAQQSGGGLALAPNATATPSPSPSPSPNVAALGLVAAEPDRPDPPDQPAEPTATADLGFVAAAPEPTVAPDADNDADDPAGADDLTLADEVPGGPVADPATVIVHARSCPDPILDPAVTIDALAAACPDPAAGLTFLINREGVTTPGFSDASGEVSWQDYGLGPFGLGLNLPPGTGVPIVYCRDDAGNAPWVRYEPSGGVDQMAIQAELTVPGGWFLCDWYLAPNPREMRVQAWACPAEIFAAGEDVAGFLDACTVPLDGIGFRLGSDGGVEERETIGGEAAWEGLPIAAVQMEEAVPDGFGEPAVFCASSESVAFARFDATGATMAYDFAAIPGEDAICHWFNVPDQGRAAVFKWVCPLGIDLETGDLVSLYDACTEVGDGVVFHLQKDGADDVKVFVAGAGWVSWDAIGAGTATIWEEIPAAFVRPVVYCSAKTNPYLAGTSEEMAVDDGAIQLAFGETYLHYSCHWFNIPGDPEDAGGWLDVTTHACPAGAVPEPDLALAADFALACPAPLDGLATTLELGDGHAPFAATTGDDGPGRVRFDLPQGTYSEIALAQAIPANGDGHALFCATGDGFAPERETEVTGDTYWLDIEPGATWDCDWYDLTTDTGDGGPGDGGGGDGGDGGSSDGDGSDDGSGDGDGDGDGAVTGTDTNAGDPGSDATPIPVTALPDTGGGQGAAAAGSASASAGILVSWLLSLAALLTLCGVMGARGAARPDRR